MAKHPLSLALLLVVVAMLWSVSSISAQQDVYSPRALELARRMHCPVCSGQTVADSNSELALQMRNIIEQKVQAGESDQQILDYFVASYGASILAEPPKSGIGMGLWWMPVLVVLVGAGVVYTYLRERTRTSATVGSSADDEELEAIAREILAGRNDAVRE